MASDEGLCVAFVSGLSASHKKKGRRAPGFSILFYVHTHSHEPGKKRAPSQSGAISRASHVAPRLRWPLAALSSRAVVNKKTAPCHEPRSEARRRRRRRDTTKPTTHANDSPRQTSRRIKRRPDPTSASREPERATAVPSFHFTPTQSGSRCQRKISFG